MIQTLIPTVCSNLCNIILWSTVSKTAQITHIPIIILLNEEGRLCRCFECRQHVRSGSTRRAASQLQKSMPLIRVNQRKMPGETMRYGVKGGLYSASSQKLPLKTECSQTEGDSLLETEN